MKFEDVESSNISKIAYDEPLRCLYVQFKKGDMWRYFDVDVGRWNAFRLDKSKGKYFTQFIKPHFKGECCADENDDVGVEYDAQGLPLPIDYDKKANKMKLPPLHVGIDMAKEGKDRTIITTIRTGSIEL